MDIGSISTLCAPAVPVIQHDVDIGELGCEGQAAGCSRSINNERLFALLNLSLLHFTQAIKVQMTPLCAPIQRIVIRYLRSPMELTGIR